MRRAVVDVGSNSVLLLVAERDGNQWRTVRETTAVTALGEGTKATGLLNPQAIKRTLDALKTAFEIARAEGVEDILAGATMAARIAKNTADFQAQAEGQGTPVAVLSGEQEAELGFLAVAEDSAFAEDDTITIIDPGGHSTELVTAQREGKGWRTRLRRSFPVGTLGLKSTLLTDESPAIPELLEAVREIDELIGLCYLPGSAGRAVVLGASGTNLISIREKMLTWEPDRVHGAWLDYEEVGRAVGWMMPMTDAERAAIPGMEPGRERTIHLGSLILERFLMAIGAPGCSVSVRGWRYALLDHPLEKA